MVGTGSSKIYTIQQTDFPYCISDGPLPDNGYAGEEYSDRETELTITDINFLGKRSVYRYCQ